MSPIEGAQAPPAPSIVQSCWRRFCQLMTAIFYRRCEVAGLESLPAEGPVVLCANHVNALVDGVVVQACCPRPIHPLARSGLFRNPLLRPVLKGIQAIPIYRRRPGEDKASAANHDSFRRCHEYLAEGRVILIFPEGQSHSDPMLRPLKTGAARMALGLQDLGGVLPAVLPVGLTFPEKGRFRSDLLVHYGRPVPLALEKEEPPEETIRRFTSAIEDGLESVTLNVDSWKDLELLRLLQHFFLLRDSRHEDERPARSLSARFRSLQQLVEAYRWLRLEHPDPVRLLREKLKRFESLCASYGVRDYHLRLRYDPGLVVRFVVRSLAFVLLAFPLVLWGVANSALPYLATRAMIRVTARGRDQYDSAGMVFGLAFFLAFWGSQTFAVWWAWGPRAALVYGLSLPVTGAVALLAGKERKRILDNVRIFFLFLRRRGLREYLKVRRQELEVDVAHLARLARQGPLAAG